MKTSFDYNAAFSRNIGWLAEDEQQTLRGKRIAIAGMGGVGGGYLLNLVRLGIGSFHIADFDAFDLVNFNRQAGANMETLGQPKVEVMAKNALAINPTLDLKTFPDGVSNENIDEFLDGVDLFVDGFDFFVMDIRARTMARAHERGIPAITAAPVGMGTAYMVFTRESMSFEDFFRMAGLPPERQYIHLGLGITPRAYHRHYLVDPSRLDLVNRQAPSTIAGVNLCAGVVAAEAVKILMKRGRIRPAPWVHQFDAYTGKHRSARLWGGNRNPLQRLKLSIGYRMFRKLAQRAESAETRTPATDMERIIDMARWAPSGDNAQPWRFRIISDDSIMVRITPERENPYEYNNGQPTMIATGFLLEGMRIAATTMQRSCKWHYLGMENGAHLIEVDFPEAPKLEKDPLAPYLSERSVNRGRYRMSALKPEDKEILAATLGPECEVIWHESFAERRALSQLNARATHIRLRIPETYSIHRKILDWSNRFSHTGIPVASLGLSAMTVAFMRHVMKSWKRVKWANRWLGATLTARLEMDLLPGLFCGAHFAVLNRTATANNSEGNSADDPRHFFVLGATLYRFWLTATRLGLAMQPSFGALCFAYYGRHGTAFTKDKTALEEAAALNRYMEHVLGEDAKSIVFFGRIGEPRPRGKLSRSLRKSLRALVDMDREAPSETGRDATHQAS